MLTFTGTTNAEEKAKTASRMSGKAFNTTTPNLPRKSTQHSQHKSKGQSDLFVVGHHPVDLMAGTPEYHPHNYWPKSGWRGKKKEAAGGFKY